MRRAPSPGYKIEVAASAHERPIVAVTGLGVLSPIGRNGSEFRSALLAGRAAIRSVGARVATPVLREHLAATLPDSEWCERLVPRADDDGVGDDPALAVALPAAAEAWADAGLAEPDASGSSRRIALLLGTSAGGMISRAVFQIVAPHERLRRHRLLHRSCPAALCRGLAQALGLDAAILTLSTACSSSTNAVVHGRDLLIDGLVDVVLAGGVEVLVEEVLGGFHAMGAVSPAPCAPFSLPLGLTVGEGAGFVVLERLSDARARGASVRCALPGAALSADGWHPTAPRPNGAGLAQAMTAALDDAAAPPARVGYLNAHGSGTEANDAAEWLAIQRCFGEQAAELPVSSTKSYLGHALGAAGVIELCATIVALQDQVVPPTLHWAGPRGAGPPDPVAETKPRAADYDLALKASAGFGGANAALVVASPEACPPRQLEGDAVWVLGSGALGPHGSDDLDSALRAAEPLWDRASGRGSSRWAGLLPLLDLARQVPGVDPRGMPTLAKHLLVAVHRALKDAGLRLVGPLRERTGLFVGVWQPSWDVVRSFWGSIAERGFDKASTHGFARLVLNAPAGLISTSLNLRGPQTVVAGGRGATLAAVALASTSLAHRRDADRIVVGSAAEVSEELLADHAVAFADEPSARACFPVYEHHRATPVLGEGAAAIVLAAERSLEAPSARPIARVAGTGAARAGQLARAIEQALAQAGWSAADVDALYGSADGSVDAGERELSALRAVLGARLDAVPLCNPAPVLGTSASLDAFALAAALEALRHRRAHPSARSGQGLDSASSGGAAHPVNRVLVVADLDNTGSWAVALQGVAEDRRGPLPVVLNEPRR